MSAIHFGSVCVLLYGSRSGSKFIFFAVVSTVGGKGLFTVLPLHFYQK